MLLTFLSDFQPIHADYAMTATWGKESPFSSPVGQVCNLPLFRQVANLPHKSGFLDLESIIERC